MSSGEHALDNGDWYLSFPFTNGADFESNVQEYSTHVQAQKQQQGGRRSGIGSSSIKSGKVACVQEEAKEQERARARGAGAGTNTGVKRV